MTRKLTRIAAAALVTLSLGAMSALPAQAGSFSIGISPNTQKQSDLMRLGIGIYSIAQKIDAKGGITQNGSNNTAGVAQNGKGNTGIVHQEGNGHYGTVAQNGNNNTCALFQFGTGTSGQCVQNGNGNTGATFQFGW